MKSNAKNNIDTILMRNNYNSIFVYLPIKDLCHFSFTSKKHYKVVINSIIWKLKKTSYLLNQYTNNETYTFKTVFEIHLPLLQENATDIKKWMINLHRYTALVNNYHKQLQQIEHDVVLISVDDDDSIDSTDFQSKLENIHIQYLNTPILFKKNDQIYIYGQKNWRGWQKTIIENKILYKKLNFPDKNDEIIKIEYNDLSKKLRKDLQNYHICAEDFLVDEDYGQKLELSCESIFYNEKLLYQEYLVTMADKRNLEIFNSIYSEKFIRFEKRSADYKNLLNQVTECLEIKKENIKLEKPFNYNRNVRLTQGWFLGNSIGLITYIISLTLKKINQQNQIFGYVDFYSKPIGCNNDDFFGSALNFLSSYFYPSFPAKYELINPQCWTTKDIKKIVSRHTGFDIMQLVSFGIISMSTLLLVLKCYGQKKYKLSSDDKHQDVNDFADLMDKELEELHNPHSKHESNLDNPTDDVIHIFEKDEIIDEISIEEKEDLDMEDNNFNDDYKGGQVVEFSDEHGKEDVEPDVQDDISIELDDISENKHAFFKSNKFSSMDYDDDINNKKHTWCRLF